MLKPLVMRVSNSGSISASPQHHRLGVLGSMLHRNFLFPHLPCEGSVRLERVWNTRDLYSDLPGADWVINTLHVRPKYKINIGLPFPSSHHHRVRFCCKINRNIIFLSVVDCYWSGILGGGFEANNKMFENKINSYLRSSSTESAQLFVVGIVVGSASISVMFTEIHFAFFDFLPVNCYESIQNTNIPMQRIKGQWS